MEVLQRKNTSFINVTPATSSSASVTATTILPSTATVTRYDVGVFSLCVPDHKYAPVPTAIATVCLIFGLLYCFFGYRFLKATMFVTGVTFGGLISYVVCQEEYLLNNEAKAGVSLLIGILVGLITMLAQHIGLFITGFCAGGLLGTGGLIVTEFFTQPPSIWVCIGTVFCPGLFCALLSFKLQKPLTILSTSLVGAAMLSSGADYFVENWRALSWVSDRLTLNTWSVKHCWLTWLLLAVWPTLSVLGLLVQSLLTAKNINHNPGVRVKRKRKSLNLQKLRDKAETAPPVGPPSEAVIGENPQNRYLHLYQVRRVNGDVISQSYIQNIQHKLSTAVRKKVVSAPSPRPVPQPSVECESMQASFTEYTPHK